MKYICLLIGKRIVFYLENNLNQSSFKTKPNK